MSEKLEDLTPNQRRALGKALAALETMASMWGVEIGLRRVSEKLAMKPEAERAKSIAAFIEQAFIEGAYRHYLDRDPSASRELESASQNVEPVTIEHRAALLVVSELTEAVPVRDAVKALQSVKTLIEYYKRLASQPGGGEAVTIREAYICAHCEGVYMDAPVSRCDCSVTLAPKWINGAVQYPALSAPSAGNGGAEGDAAPTTGHSHEHP